MDPGGHRPARVRLWLAQRPERRPDLGREQLGFFPGGEVAAPGGFVEVAEVGIDPLDPAARGRDDLAGEGGEADRDRDRRRSLPGSRRKGCGLCDQYDRAAEAPVPVSQYSVMLSTTLSRVRWPAGCLSRKAREIL